MNEKIFVFVDWYEPGFRGGGPIRSCVNFAEHLKENFEIFVFTRDRDLGMDEPYREIVTDQWIKRDGINVFYASPQKLKWSHIVFQLREAVRPEYVYINGVFSRVFSVYPVLIKRLYGLRAKCVIAPRGMFKATALQFKRSRKIAFLKVLRLLNVYDKITFQATDQTEESDVKNICGRESDVRLIPNFPAKPKAWVEPPEKTTNQLSIIFLGRTHPIKNLHLLLQWLPQIKASIKLTIVTTDENATYWNECKELINRMPESVDVIIRKDVPHAEVEEIISKHHVLVLPTEGENFGHAIFEALSLGKPVIISDQTPWRKLQQKRAGWDLPLSESHKFIAAIATASAWNQQELNLWSYNAWRIAAEYSEDKHIKELYLDLFSNQ